MSENSKTLPAASTQAFTAPAFGLLNINKPPAVSSRWVVDRVQRLVGAAKAGHAGTLDPLATGVLVVCVGQATRLVDYVQQMPKRYRAKFLLGRTSPTEDIEGEISELADPPLPSRSAVETAAGQFVGEIMQRPPAYSALKVSGKRAYALARRGQKVELTPRPVMIHQFELLEYDYPRAVFDIECSSGTYVRSLGRDLAVSLGTGAVMSALQRMAIGSFQVEDAIDVTRLTRDNIAAHLLPSQLALQGLQQLVLTASEQQRIVNGQFIDRSESMAQAIPPTTLSESAEFAALDGCGNLVALLRRRADGQLGPVRNFQSG